MKNVEVLIVGGGLSGSILSETLSQNNISHVVIDNNKNVCSSVAAGLWNPIVFKRITKSWKADILVDTLLEFYSEIEQKYSISILELIEIVKLFNSIEEENDWLSKANDDGFSRYLSSEKIESLNPDNFTSYKGGGKVKHSGRLNISVFLKTIQETLKNNGNFYQEEFNFQDLTVSSETVKYKNITANKIIFCEGVNVAQNPYFNYLPISSTKGEVLNISIPDFNSDYILNKGFFLYPEGNSNFIMGSTYHWNNTSLDVTKEGLKELDEKYLNTYRKPYTIIEKKAGLRPTTLDRRPILGAHPHHKNMFIFNGMGTKGVMIAPFFAKHLVEHITYGIPLEKEVDINRYKHLLK